MDKLDLNKIYNMDCIDFMKTLPSECVDLIIADPPYYKAINEKWDKQWKTEEEFLNWTKEWFNQCVRIMKPTGVFYCYGNFDILTKQKVLIFDKQLNFRQNITLHKGLKSIAGRTSDKLRMFPTATEYLLYYTKQSEEFIKQEYNKNNNFFDIMIYLKDEFKKARKDGWTTRKLRELLGLTPSGGGLRYFSESAWIFPSKNIYEKFQKTEFFNRVYDDLLKEYNSKRFTFNLPTGITDVWDFTSDKTRYGHKTQKPSDITDRIIKASSNENDIIYIPFAGSGSEIVGCIKNNRNYIATEINKEYIEEIINTRIENTYNELNNKEIVS